MYYAGYVNSAGRRLTRMLHGVNSVNESGYKLKFAAGGGSGTASGATAAIGDPESLLLADNSEDGKAAFFHFRVTKK